MKRRDFLKAIGAAGAGLVVLRKLPPARAATTVWSGSVSVPDGYTIPAGAVVELDPNVTTTVETRGNIVVLGTLRMRPANAAVMHTLRFTSIDEAKFVGGGLDPISSDVGLWVMPGGKLDVAGASKTAWGRASATVNQGATSLTLDRDPVGWRIGDEIAICPTQSPSVSDHYLGFEVRTIASISGRTIGWSSGLARAHPAVTVKPGLTFTAEVLNLTRNARIEGTATGRAHVFFRPSSQQTISHVSIRHMGPQKSGDSILGRYGLHFHHADGVAGSLVEGVVIRDTGAHAFAPHSSDGITFRDCIAYNVFNVAYWWDPPNFDDHSNDSQNILYDRCVAALVWLPSTHSTFHTVTGFQFGSGSGNSALGCVAVGVNGGKTSSGFLWGSKANGSPGAWSTVDNVSHNHRSQGAYIWQNAIAPDFTDDRFVAYHNTDVGIDWGAYQNGHTFRDAVLFGNKAGGIRIHAVSADSPRRLKIERAYVDGAGLSEFGIVSWLHYADGPQSVLLDTCELRGFTKAAFACTRPKNPFPDEYYLKNCTYVGNEFWLDSAIHQGSLITVDDPTHGLLKLRRADQAGVFKPAWNARLL